jgi:Mg-chelatase subunit ChlI
MATVKDTFNAVISEAVKNADLISDNYQKARALAAIAHALAATGLVSDVTAEAPAKAEKEEKKETKAKKTADKMKRQPKELPPEEEVKEEPKAEESKSEEEPAKKEEAPKGDFTEEWTDEATEAFAEELQYIMDFTEKWGEEAANTCLADFSEGVLTDISSDVNPLNIAGVVAAFRKLEADAESAA